MRTRLLTTATRNRYPVGRPELLLKAGL